MKWKEALGIGIGILCFAAAIYGLILGSKDDEKGRTEPVAQYTWQKATFADKELNQIVEDLQLKYIHGFLFRKDSMTPVYFPIYIGKSAKGAEGIKAYFPDAKKAFSGYMSREEAALKILDVKNPVIYSGKKIRNDIEVFFADDFVIITFASQATNVVLDNMQMEHFLHRYFRENKPEEKAKPEAKSEEKPAAKTEAKAEEKPAAKTEAKK